MRIASWVAPGWSGSCGEILAGRPPATAVQPVGRRRRPGRSPGIPRAAPAAGGNWLGRLSPSRGSAMPPATLARLVSRCRGLAARAGAVPDAELVRRFARSGDPDAFAELVGRYAGLVWGVCRRTLPQEADAEDAFQATFLALARGARAIDPRRPVGAWLHAVAVRVSRRALGRALRRRTSELPEVAGPADAVRDVSGHDLFRAV